MQTVKAIYDGTDFKPVEPIPVNGKYEVIITFTKQIESKEIKKQRLLKHFGSWNQEDVNVIDKIILERGNFSINRVET